MPWAITKKVYVLVSICLAVLVAGLVSVQMVSADAITGENNDGLAVQTERWLRLRAISKCFDSTDVGKNSYNRVEEGKFLTSSNERDARVAIGYLNSDGKVSCGDGAFVSNTLSKIGFGSNIEAFCSVQPMASRGSADTKDSDNFDGCVNGEGDEFDMDSGAFDQGALQLKQFKTGYAAHASTPSSWNPTPAMMYHVYRQSLLKFCGAQLIGKYDPADKNNIDANVRRVVVNDVDLSTGEIIPNVYKLTKDQGDTVDDIYVNNDMNNVSNVSCGKMAQKTWDYDDDMSAYVKAYIDRTGDVGSGYGGGDGDGSSSSNTPVCSAGALGWVICPAIDFLGVMNDTIYSIVENMLYIDPVTVENGGPLYDTWARFRDIANILFVVFFMIVVFSQATSVGLSKYGIKKLLPRILAAAILVNISFFLCQIALDISNIVGVGITDLVGSMRSSVKLDVDVLSWDTVIGVALAGGGAYAGIGLITGAYATTGALAMILPFLVTALFAIVTAIAILIARQVIIILLIALAPLAFVALILPNTQKYFQMWQNTFTTMLVMFPLIAMLFAGSQLAANIVLTSATGPDGISFFALIAAVSMMFIPLFGVPYIVKFSGGTIGKLAGIVNNPNKGPFDALRKRAEAYRDFKKEDAFDKRLNGPGATSKFGKFAEKRGLTYRGKAMQNVEREERYASAKRRQDARRTQYLGEQLAPNEEGEATNASLARRLAGGTATDELVRKVAQNSSRVAQTGYARGLDSKIDANALNRVMSQGVQALDEQETKDLKSDQILLQNARMPGEGLKQLLENVDATGLNGQTVKASRTMQLAAASMMMQQGREMDTVVQTLAKSGDKKVREFAVGQIQSNFQNAKERQVGLTDESLMGQISNGSLADESTFQAALAASTIKKAKDLTLDKFSGQEATSMKRVKEYYDTLSSSAVPLTAEQTEIGTKLKSLAVETLKNQGAKTKTTDETLREIEEMAKGTRF